MTFCGTLSWSSLLHFSFKSVGTPVAGMEQAFKGNFFFKYYSPNN